MTLLVDPYLRHRQKHSEDAEQFAEWLDDEDHLRDDYPYGMRVFGMLDERGPEIYYAPAKKRRVLAFAASTQPQIERFTGIVDAIRDKVAYLMVTDEKGQEIEIEWDAADLQSKSIEEGNYFHLTTTTRGEDMVFEFRPVAPKPLPEESRREIEELLSRYRDRGFLDDDEP